MVDEAAELRGEGEVGRVSSTGFRRRLRWWLAFLAGTLVLSFTGDLEAAKKALEKLFEGDNHNTGKRS